MDRRSRLWRRKSSEKSPGETESSGSMSSHSERFSDDQANPTHTTLLPEVTSKAPRNEEEDNESVETLTEKLSAALLNSSAKDDLVKQHAKVAEEAVSGWEKAENEVLGLKQQLEAANQKNSALEDRVGHLDGALKECVRQIRQAREEQDQNTREVVAIKTREWESSKSVLQSQLVDLQAQLQTANTEAAASIDFDLSSKLEATEKENSALQLKLLSRVKELEVRTIERDLSAQAAETASKQYLESIKRVSKLEAECRRLKALTCKTLPANDHKLFSTSSVYIESFTDSPSDSGERVLAIDPDPHKVSGLYPIQYDPSQSDSRASAQITEHGQFKNEKDFGKNLMVPSVEINLMDDFLEMERLAALSDTENDSCHLELGIGYQPHTEENPLKTEFETMIQRATELERKLEKMAAEKVELEMTLSECQKQLETSQSQLVEADMKLEDLKRELALANDSVYAADEEVKTYQTMRVVAESQLRAVQTEFNSLLLKVGSLEEEVWKERNLSAENVAKCLKLENELFSMKHEAECQREVELQRLASTNGELKIKQEKELALAANRFAECQKTIASLGQQLKSLTTLEDILVDSESPPELIEEGMQCHVNSAEPHNLHPNLNTARVI
ncbi:hypothetical protein PRUPE_4G281900 [Prunus persica]|uniref:Filament-like plant protein n=1 Tax=Prunus persica TaxID=3760 RepID=M5WRH8_PRUPE|nr:filament-like plant protein [Prunus persica]XP_020418347.1 filament-like plant protein [Prunus persica]XP_020418348.1 filament-like plant protein [Prunus persica]ONI14465.1 hypothetical protein PRUPE_4G281900 [Prunus persica]ONI14466.1 hypothetical protein PRUPE_4G281900 [Prunus persica]ONI14467.1 hypothetical protein PRUPE_4G281900 [Prunus persica]ONI14468.1 hypothetical protein PRUPE_4G281900 [Prunus persica]